MTAGSCKCTAVSGLARSYNDSEKEFASGYNILAVGPRPRRARARRGPGSSCAGPVPADCQLSGANEKSQCGCCSFFVTALQCLCRVL